MPPEEEKRSFASLSRDMFDNAQYIATESDHWFLSALRGVDRGTSWAKDKLYGGGRQVVGGLGKVLWWRERTAKGRIQKLLHKEAKRSKLEVAPEDFDLFSERFATLAELVLTGELAVDAIAFEEDESHSAAETVPTQEQPIGDAEREGAGT